MIQGFWRDFWSYLFIDHPGATAAAFIASAGSAFVLGNTVIDVEAASTMKLLIAGAATGYIADSVANSAMPVHVNNVQPAIDGVWAVSACSQ